jgi:hypothetical protein
MSLTSILSDPRNQELREKLKSEFPKPPFHFNDELGATPLTKNYGLVGTAFDYLLRFYLEFINKDRVIIRKNWVADSAYQLLRIQLKNHRDSNIEIGFHKNIPQNVNELSRYIEDQYNLAKSNYNNYIIDGIISDELVQSSIFLAKLDTYFRSKIIDQYFTTVNILDIQDVKSIFSLLDSKLFTAKQKCYLNPVFGTGSILVGGADADLIIDDTLIDIKVTKNLRLGREHFNQLIGYYTLSRIGGINDNTNDKPIKNIALYFARHGILWKTSLSELGNNKQFEDFKIWFQTYICAY